MNMVYRSYRLPYEWVPQLEKPAESPIERLDVSTFRVPGAAAPGVKSAVEHLEGSQGVLRPVRHVRGCRYRRISALSKDG